MDKVQEAILALSDEKLLRAKMVCEIFISSLDFKFENDVQEMTHLSTVLRRSLPSRTIINLSGDVIDITGESIVHLMSTPNNPLSKRKFMLVEVEEME